MIDMQDVNAEIAHLEAGNTSYSNCEKLAILYTVRDHLNGVEHKPDMPMLAPSAYSYATSESEFIRSFKSIPLDDALAVLDEHMDAVRALYPKEYAAVIRKIRSTIN